MHTPSIAAPFVTVELSAVEQQLLRQAALRASERHAVAENDLNTYLGEIASLARAGRLLDFDVPPPLLIGLRSAVEDFASSGRTLYPSAEQLVLSLKRDLSFSILNEEPRAHDLVRSAVGWAIEAYFAP